MQNRFMQKHMDFRHMLHLFCVEFFSHIPDVHQPQKNRSD